MNLKKNTGITLIALIITVVILLILAAVSVVALRDTNLFERTQRATQVYNESRLDEEDKLAGYKYAIDEHDPNVATINKLRGSSHLTLTMTTDDYVTATVTAVKGNPEGIDLTNYKIMMVTGDSDFIPDEDSDWEEIDTMEITISENKMVYATLFDGTKYGASASTYVTLANIDNEAPTVTIANIKESTNVLFSISGEVTITDAGTGVDYTASKYVFNNSADPLGENGDLYTDGTLTEQVNTIDGVRAYKPGTNTFYLHVLAVDNKGNKKEEISEGTSITISSNKLFSYTGSAQPTQLAPGSYQLEVWGAQGGRYQESGTSGKGGYSIGKISITNKTAIYAYVGGQGTSRTTSYSAAPGGFNGGGQGGSAVNSGASNKCYAGSGGGGGTDFRIGSDSLYARVIVAGGGGGSAGWQAGNLWYGGYGGGTSGNSASASWTAPGGTQTSGGAVNGSNTYSHGSTSRTNNNYEAGGGGGRRWWLVRWCWRW